MIDPERSTAELLTFSDTDIPVVCLAEDGDMLAGVVDTPGVEVDQAFVDNLNTAIERTHINPLRSRNDYSLWSTGESVRSESARRQDVYRQLGWLDPAHALHGHLLGAMAHHALPPSPKKLIATLRILYAYTGDELLPVLENDPDGRLLIASTERLSGFLRALQIGGVDPLVVLATNPRIIYDSRDEVQVLAKGKRLLDRLDKKAAAENRRALIMGQSTVQIVHGQSEVPEQIAPERRSAIDEIATLMEVDSDALVRSCGALAIGDDEFVDGVKKYVERHLEQTEEPLRLRELLFFVRDTASDE